MTQPPPDTHMTLIQYLTDKDLSQAEVKDLQQHTHDYLKLKGKHDVADANHRWQSTVDSTRMRSSRDIMYECWEIEDYVQSQEFYAYILEHAESRLCSSTRNELLLRVLGKD